MKLVIEINALPPVLKQLMSKGWKWRWRTGKEWETLLACGTTAEQRRMLTRAKGIRKVSLMVRHLRLWDEDNAQSAYKVLLDAGTRLGFWRDDSAQFVMVTPVTQEKAKGRSEVCTRLTIETEEA